MKTYIISTAILPNYGIYKFEPLTVEEAQKILKENDFVSAVGHQSTAEALSELLNMDIPFNRISINYEPGDIAVVFKLKRRPPEGAILTKEQLEEIGYELGKITRIK